jgi:hypothetical protein
MKKLLIITIIAFNAITIFAQTQKFDVMTYTPPKGWTAGQNGSAKTFTTIDKPAGKFCLMMLHPSVTNHGTPSQDFAFVWKTLVQDTFNSGGNPEKETTQADGFTIIQGGELIDYEGTKALAMLTTVSGKGKVISLLTLMNDAKYADDVQKFLGGMDIDIKKTEVESSPRQNVGGLSLQGKWSEESNAYSVSHLSTDARGGGFKLTFDSEGKYTEEFLFITSHKKLISNEIGNFKVNGNYITFSNCSMNTKVWKRETLDGELKFRSNDTSKPVARTYRFQIVPLNKPGELMLELWEKDNEVKFPNNPDRKMWKK